MKKVFSTYTGKTKIVGFFFHSTKIGSGHESTGFTRRCRQAFSFCLTLEGKEITRFGYLVKISPVLYMLANGNGVIIHLYCRPANGHY